MPVEVTPQKSAEINECIGQLCGTAASAREIAAQLNLKFGLDWHPHTYWRRALKSGHEWPRKVRRLTTEESEKMDQRLRELCVAGTPGTEIRKKLNSEFDLPWTFQTYFQRADRLGLDWTTTPRAERPWAGAESLPEDQRTACYEDPAYEARNKIADRVICRECFAMLRDGGMDGKRGHLWLIERKILGCDDPEKVRKCYRRRNPGAPLFTFQRIAKQQGLDVFRLMAKEVDLYATLKERADADSDPEYEEKHMPEYAICRELRCGFKSRGRLTKHLANEHDIHGKKAVKAWRRQHDWAPIIAPDAAKKSAERERNNRLRELEKTARQAGQTEAPKDNDRGPKPLREEEKQHFKIGVAVDKEIPIGLKNDRHCIVEARRRVAARTHLEYDTVAQYHGEYRRWLKKQPLMTIPA